MNKEDFERVAPHLTPVPLEIGDVVAAPGETIEAAYFPEAGIVSFADMLNDGSRIGIGHLGHEGFTGWPILLGCPQSSHYGNVTVDVGTALVIESGPLIEACRASPTLNALLLRFVQAFLIQLGRTVVSNLTQPVEPRLARWILMGHDRIDGDEIKVTHNEICVMLGVRRASVTDALHLLEGEGMIRARRGHVIVRDRARLRQVAGESYGFAEAEYSRLIAPFGKDG